MAKRRRKNSLIESISAQAAVSQAQVSDQLSAISSSNEQTEITTQYESLTEAVEQISDLNADFMPDIKPFTALGFSEAVSCNNECLAKLQNAEAEALALSSANMKLQSENASLQEENDKYLMKISELTFENAKLNAQLQELSKNAMPKFNETTIPNTFDNSTASKNVNYPYRPNNMGYTSWN